MKTIKTIFTLFTLCLLCSFASAQGNCPGLNVKVYKGAKGCGCHCQTECVTPLELPLYLADGWNTIGCWNCCKFKNWVEAETPKTESDVKVQVTDMTGRCVATGVDESSLTPGIYFVTIEDGVIRETKKITVQ